jgi:hypothetical protein
MKRYFSLAREINALFYIRNHVIYGFGYMLVDGNIAYPLRNGPNLLGAHYFENE